MTTPTVTFFNGQQMPIVGLGTYLATNSEELENALEESLKAGYRHIDTAFVYTNESIIGNVLKRWLDEGKVKRKELFIVTKLPPHGMHPSRVNHFLKKSLASLQLDYVDLYLIHSPCGIKYGEDDVSKLPMVDGKLVLDTETSLEKIWKAMEEQVDAGLAKSIGISNFNSKQVERVVEVARIKPANLQVELSVYVQMKEVRAVCEKHGITLCAYTPLGRPGNKEKYKAILMLLCQDLLLDMLQDPKIVELAKKHNVAPAQIALKFLVQQNIVVIPKIVTPSRIQQNIQLFGFSLSDQELAELVAMDRGIMKRVCFTRTSARGMHEHPEFPYPV